MTDRMSIGLRTEVIPWGIQSPITVERLLGRIVRNSQLGRIRNSREPLFEDNLSENPYVGSSIHSKNNANAGNRY